MDIVGDTNSTTTIPASDVLFSEIEVANDLDYIRLDLLAGLAYSFTVSSQVPFFDPGIQLRDANDTFIASLFNNNDPITLSRTIDTSGTFFAVVFEQGGGDTGDYALQINREDNVVGNTSSTTALNTTGVVSSAIDVSGDEDYYAVNMTAGLAVGYTVFVDTPGGSLNVRLRDGADDVVFGGNFSNGAISLGGTVDVSGAYYLAVDGNANSTSDYRIVTNTNDTIVGDTTSTTTFGSEGGTIDSAIDVLNDRDFVGFTAQEGLHVGVRVVSSSGDADDISASATGTTATLQSSGGLIDGAIRESGFLALGGGQGFIDVSAQGGFTGDYSLTVNLDDTVRADIGTTEILSSGQTFSSSVDAIGDVDVFSIDLMDGFAYGFTLSGLDADFSGELQLLNDVGTLITSLTGSNGDDIVFSLPQGLSGQHFISVDQGLTDSSRTSQYALTFNASDTISDGSAGANTVIFAGDTIQSALDVVNDEDRIFIDLQEGLTYDFQLTVDPGKSGQSLQLRNAAGDLVENAFVSGNGIAQFDTIASASETFSITVGGANSESRLTGYTLTVDDTDTVEATAATTNAQLTSGQPFMEALDTENDRDVFLLDLVVGLAAGVSVTSSTSNFNYNITAFDPVGNSVSGELSDASGTANLNITAGSTGTFSYLIQDSGGSLGTYTITANTSDNIIGDSSTTTFIGVGPLMSAIDVNGDRDFVGFNITEGMHFGVDVTSSLNSISSLSTTVTAGTGAFIFAGSDSDGDLQRQSFLATDSGTTFVDLTSFNSSGDYTLAVNTDDLAQSTIADTTSVIAPGTSITQAIDVEGDIDVHEITLAAGFAYSFDLSGLASDFAGRLILRDSSGTQLDSISAGSGDDLSLTRTPNIDETVYLFVQRGFTGVSDTSSYTLTVNNDDDISAFNGTPQTSLGPSGLQQSTIDVVGDQDQFFFTLQEGLSYSVRLEFIGERNAQNIELLDPAFGSVDTQFSLPGNVAQIDHTATVTGDFSVVVGGANSSVPSFDYTISLNSDDVHFNSRALAQQTIVNAGVETGRIDQEGDVDYIKVDLIAGREYRFEYTIDPDGFSPIFQVEQSDGTVLNTRQAFNPVEFFLYTPTAAETVFISVDGQGNQTGDWRINIFSDEADTINGTATDDVLIGGSGIDTINGFDGADTIEGGEGADVLDGGAGDDDTLSYDQENVELSVNLATQTAGGVGSDAEGDTISGFENVIGGIRADMLTGSGDANKIFGGGGDDIINAGLGNDFVDGGFGADTIDGEGGIDTITFASLNAPITFDMATGATNTAGESIVNFEVAIGGTGNDQILGNGEDNIIEGGDGNDDLQGRDGADELIGGAGRDNLVGGQGTDTLNAGRGNDTLDGGTEADQMAGGLGDDTYTVDDVGDVVIEAELEGNDVVTSFVDFDVPVNVEVLIMAGSGDLRSNGTDARDIIIGNAGNNTINGAGGIDVMQGGAGDDTYAVDNSFDAVIETSGGGNDAVFASVDYVLDPNQEIETGILTGDAVILRGDDSNNQLFGNDNVNVLEGKRGTDFLLGFGGDDIFQISVEANASDLDVIGDFEGAGVAGGDRLAFDANIWGTDGIVMQLSQTSFQVSSADGSNAQQFIIQNLEAGNSGLLEGDDYFFG